MSAKIIPRQTYVSNRPYYHERRGNICRGPTRMWLIDTDISSPTETRRAECMGRMRVRRHYIVSLFRRPCRARITWMWNNVRSLRHRVAQPRAVRLSLSRNRTINACDNVPLYPGRKPRKRAKMNIYAACTSTY